MSPFAKAVKHEAKLRMAIAGPSGSGKTYTALAIATALANGSPVALVDTEHGSASKYADIFAFDVLELQPPFHPDRFGETIAAAAKAGYSVLVLDSLTHAWNGAGGLLEIVDQIAARMKTANTYAAWKDATPIQNRLVEAIIGAPLHIIATMRSKQEYIQDTDDRGKSRIRKVGMTPVQREGFEYEFDVFLDMDIDNNALVSKTRCPALTGHVYPKPGAEIAAILSAWLQGQPAPAPKIDPTTGEVTGANNGNGKHQTTTDTSIGPRSPEALRAHLQSKAIDGEKVQPLSDKWHGALVGHLDKLTNTQHRLFLAYVFSLATGSSHELSPGQWHAIKNWLALAKDETETWYPDQMAAAECKAVMALLAPATQAALLEGLAADNPMSSYAQGA